MKIGIYVPQFRENADSAFKVAELAEQHGIDGLFVFDHLIAPDHPERPSLNQLPMLGAMAARTESIAIGTLVSRVGVVSAQTLLKQLHTAHEVSDGRLISCLGMSSWTMEFEAKLFEADIPPIVERAHELEVVARDLIAHGIETWIASHSRRMHDLARQIGAGAQLWSSHEEVGVPLQGVPTIWGEHCDPDRDQLARKIHDLEAAGFSWAVFLLRGIGTQPVEAVNALLAARALA